MNEAFVPLTGKVSPNPAAEPFVVKVLAKATGAAVPFQPPGARPGGTSAPAAHDEHAGQTHVSLVRDGERITAVRVQCGCGEVIELQCVY